MTSLPTNRIKALDPQLVNIEKKFKKLFALLLLLLLLFR